LGLSVEVWQNIGQILSGVLIGVTVFVFSKLKVWLKKKRVASIVADNVMLKQLLAEIRAYYDADRVELYQFHNGDHFVSGASIQKASLTHLVLARGVSPPINTNTQNIPIGYIAFTAEDLLKNKYSFLALNDLCANNYLHGLLRHGGAHCALMRGIFNAKSDMIGFLVLSWFDEVVLTDVQYNMIQVFGVQVGDELLLGSK